MQNLMNLEESVSLDDPQFKPLEADEEATPEEEAALAKALSIVGDHLYSEEGQATVVKAMENTPDELFKVVPNIAEMYIQKVRTEFEGEEIPPAVYFGEGGLLQMVPIMILETAEAAGVPGAEDEDQIAASVMALHQRAAEFIRKEGDENAMAEAAELGSEVLRTQPDGSVRDADEYIETPARKPVAEGVSQGLLGV